MGSVSMQSVSSSHGERLSAFVDGEFTADEHLNGIFSELDHEDRKSWSAYHLIGDVLRSDDLALSPTASHAFMNRFAALLETEPHVLAPAASARSAARRLLGLRRRVVPTLAVIPAGDSAIAVQIRCASSVQSGLGNAVATRNSSPPLRPTTASVPAASSMARATCTSASSPVACP